MDNSREVLRDGMNNLDHTGPNDAHRWSDDEIGHTNHQPFDSSILDVDSKINKRMSISSILDNKYTVLNMIRCTTVGSLLFSILCLLIRFGGSFMSLMVLIHNIEMSVTLCSHEVEGIIHRRSSSLIFRGILLFLLKPIANICFCMVTYSPCTPSSPDTLATDLPLFLGIITLLQVYLIHTYKKIIDEEKGDINRQ